TGRRPTSIRSSRRASLPSRSSSPKYAAAGPSDCAATSIVVSGKSVTASRATSPRSILATGCWSPATYPDGVLRLVLPKGSLEQATHQLFEDADLALTRASDVDYKATIDDPRVIDVTILRPQEIPRYVARGLFDLGVTGRDWIEETDADVVTIAQLHYSKATARPFRIVVAVAGDSPYESVKDLPAGV